MAEENQPIVYAANEGNELSSEPITPVIEAAIPEVPIVAEKKELSDNDFLEFYNKKNNTSFKSFDEIAPAKPEPTQDDIAKENAAKNEKLFAAFKKKGGTLLQFEAIQSIANSDVKEFSYAEAKRELMDAGLSKEEAENEITQRYYLMSDEEKSELSDEDSLLIKKHEIFSKKLENRSAYKIENAKQYMQNLQTEAEQEEYEAQVDAKISAKVAELKSTAPKSIVMEMGESNGMKLSPITFDVREEDVQEIYDTFSDPQKRNKFLYNEDGSEKVEEIIEALKLKKIMPTLVKKAMLQGATEQVEIFESKYGKTPHDVAPGYTPKAGNLGRQGKAIEGSERVRVMPQKIVPATP